MKEQIQRVLDSVEMVNLTNYRKMMALKEVILSLTTEPNSRALGDTRREVVKTDTTIRGDSDERLADRVSKQLSDTDLDRLSTKRDVNSVNAEKTLDNTRYDNKELASDNGRDLSTTTHTKGGELQTNGNERFETLIDTNRPERDRRIRQQYARSEENIITGVKLKFKE